MNAPTSGKKIFKVLNAGIGRTLFISFLLVALLPMLTVSLISLQQARTNLRQQAEAILEQVAVTKSRQISQYFQSMQKALVYEAEREENMDFLEALLQTRGNKSIGEFVGSFYWAMLVDEQVANLTHYCRSFNFYDVFLIAANGDVFFSVAKEDDLGTNLFNGPYKSTKFAAACKKSLETGEVSFSDYENYASSGGLIYGFLTVPMVDAGGERIGVMAVQFPLDPIAALLGANGVLDDVLDNYLVGPDLTLRSHMIRDPERSLLNQKIVTEQTKLFKGHLGSRLVKEGMDSNAFIYEGPLGNQVVGVHHEVVIGDVLFALVTEVGVDEAFSVEEKLRRNALLLAFLVFLLVLLIIPPLVLKIVRPLVQLTRQTKLVARGDYSNSFETNVKNEIGVLSRSFNTMVTVLRENKEQGDLNNWLQDGQLELYDITRAEPLLTEFCRKTVSFLAEYIGAEIGAMYTTAIGDRLKLSGSYALSTGKQFSNDFTIGQGVVGQAALTKRSILLASVPEDYIEVQSGLGKSVPRCILVVPIVIAGKVLAVIELGSLNPFSDRAQEFIENVSENIGVSIRTLLGNRKVQELLEQAQTQTEELASREEELSQSNQILEKQTSALKASESSLQAQQEELRQTNEELEEQAQLLEKQKTSLNSQNIHLEQARKDMETASRYKSEFLANMSHELRTPLNSILLLSQHLANNKDATMTEKQVECASTVHNSGTELLNLINEILDLAKVESGKIVLEPDDCYLEDIALAMKQNFQPVADDKGVKFILQVAVDVPKAIYSDCQRVGQIIKNLLSNAFKFTESGSVKLEISRDEKKRSVNFIVTDSGIGISKESIESIFHAFQQEDGSTSRKYGGTGLGLSISRELASLLGGQLGATSVQGQGATFTLSLPEKLDTAPLASETIQSEEPADTNLLQQRFPEQEIVADNYLPDDRKEIDENSRSILIIEDDQTFARILRDSARERGFKTLVAESGETGLQMTEQYKPDGIILDMGLPGIDGRHVLARLKEDLKTRHIPVHILSAADDTSSTRQMGAVGYLTKPVSMEAIHTTFARIERVLARKVKTVLLVEDDEVMCREVVDLVSSSVVHVTTAATGKEAMELLRSEEFDCIIVDLGLPDTNGCDLIKEMKRDTDFDTPVIIHTARELTGKEQQMLDTLSDSIVVKDAKSMDRLLDESSLFLHRVATDLPEAKKEIIRKFHDRETILENKKILIVDDDMRNVFSLSSILEEKGMITEMAENGKVALEKLAEQPDTDLILMDIMMPEMDGYEAMKEIRKMDASIAKVAIIALTAKAMKGDRARCIEAGANDYLAKPVDAEKLFSMLRVWLY